jgi:hypothetical protein
MEVKMFELSKDSYEILHEPVLKIPFNMLMARSVILGHVDGSVFVDSCECPKSFYIVQNRFAVVFSALSPHLPNK